MLYSILRKMMFQMSPERAHHFAMQSMSKLCSTSVGEALVHQLFKTDNSNLQREVFGLKFKNPVGIAAGFDKDAKYLKALQALGFGSVEIGTVTPKGQPGNDQPRLFRLPKDKAIINRMGFNNSGVEVVRTRLELWQKNRKNTDLVIGGNIGKNKVTPNEDAWKDYVICFQQLRDVVDYFTVNVSSPNTPGLRALQEKDSLRKIFSEIKNINLQSATTKPVLLKIAPDLSIPELDDIISLAQEIELDGLVTTNTTIARSGLITDASVVEAIGAGGLSGKPLQQRSTEVLSYLHQHLGKDFPIIASGGIFTGKDAEEKLNHGATLIQVYTGFIYEGPDIAKAICKYLD